MVSASGARSLCAVVLCWWCFAGAVPQAGEEPLAWSTDLKGELAQARAAGRPVVVLVRDLRDLATLDAAHWLTEDAALNAVLKDFHRVLLWNDSLECGRLPCPDAAGLVFLTPNGELIWRAGVPLQRAELRDVLSKAHEWPVTPDELVALCEKALSRVLAPDPPGVEGKGAGTVPLLLHTCEVLQTSGRAERAAALLQRPEAGDTASYLVGLDEMKVKADLERLRQALGASRDDEARALAWAILADVQGTERKSRAASFLAEAFGRLEMDGAREVLLKKLKDGDQRSRVGAQACLELGRQAAIRNGWDAAKDYWKAAEKMADGGESPALFRAARSLRWLAEGKDTPRRSRWAKREVLDVVVLVPDLPTFAEAVSCWTDKVFFPVLFQDDLYAPKFIAAFKPAQVLTLGNPGTAWTSMLSPDFPTARLTPEDLRRVLLHSWTKPDERGKWPAAPADDALRARLGDLDGATGVIFTDGVSGELAGALALAAGRFQGLEILPPPATLRPSLDDARELARRVEEGLRRWGLPREERTAYVTLAGKYPLTYRGLPYGSTGNVYALDDLLGRAEDTTRLAVTGRLTGGAAAGAYQAACSLFLKPDPVALLVDAWSKEGPGWDEYHLAGTERSWRESLTVTNFHGAGARERYRAQGGLWNRGCRISLLQTGGGATASNAEDLAAGEPSLIILTQPGAADDPGDVDTLCGRALWGGAFWCLGAVGEPFLQGFQPVSFHAEQLARGAAFAVALRRSAGQPFAWPWRVAVFGDPQFCLREKPAKRKAWKEQDGPLVRAGEKPAGKNPVSLAMLVEEHLRTGAALDAWKLWAGAPDEARQALAPRLYARQAACFLLDRALSAQELENALLALDAVLLTGPAPESAGCWLERTAALARQLDRVPPFAAWLAARAEDASLKGYREVFHERIRRLGGEVLNGNGKRNGR
jgi:hypothetical protein